MVCKHEKDICIVKLSMAESGIKMSDTDFEACAFLLPCDRCKLGERVIHRMPNTRLGKHEREILASNEATPPREEYEQRALYNSYHRALRKLRRVGLYEGYRRTYAGEVVADIISKNPGVIRWERWQKKTLLKFSYPPIMAAIFTDNLNKFCDDIFREKNILNVFGRLPQKWNAYEPAIKLLTAIKQ